MDGLGLIGASLAIFLIACAGILACTLQALRFAGAAFNRARGRSDRRRLGALAALCFAGVFASAAGGFAGISGVFFVAGRTAPAGQDSGGGQAP